MGKNHFVVFNYALAHFVVDFACAFLLFRVIYGAEQWYLCLLLYNFCAFALQMPLGLLADRLNRNAVCAAIGCGLIVLSYTAGSMVVVAVVIAGIGNGLFHVGGGVDVLNMSKKSPVLLGIFVSPGALGLFLGAMFGKLSGVPIPLVIMVLLLTAGSILVSCRVNRPSFRSNNAPISFEGIPRVLLAIGCLLFVVCLRSYIGMLLRFPWKEQGNFGTILVFAVVLGKMAGGFLAMKLGPMKASVLSLGLAAVLFWFSDNAVLGIAAVFFFNMTMPITLWAVARRMPGCKGFSFGLLTFGLFLGFVPVYLGYEVLFNSLAGFAFAALISMALLWVGLRKVVD